MSRLRIINLGLPKTGTTTLTDALRQAGLTVADWKIRRGQSKRNDIIGEHVGKVIYADYFDSGDPLARLDEFDMINEMSAVRHDRSLWPQTDWGLLAAIQDHHPNVKFLPMADIPGLPRGFGASEDELARWLEGHFKFCRRVFQGCDNFLEYDIEDADAQGKIAGYLGIDLPWWGQSNVGRPADAEKVT